MPILSDLTLIMASYNRPWYIPAMLQSYADQEVQASEYLIWNNEPAHRNQLEAMVGEYDLPIRLIHHDDNVGGFARYYASRDLVHTEYVAFVDDDWEMKPNFLSHLHQHRRPDAIVGTWGWNYRSPVSRRRVEQGPADYLGTCGMLAPRTIFDAPGLYDEIPEQYWFLEDIWLCYFARHRLGIETISCGKLEDIARNMNRDDEGTLTTEVLGLADSLTDLKPEFVAFLKKNYDQSKWAKWFSLGRRRSRRTPHAA